MQGPLCPSEEDNGDEDGEEERRQQGEASKRACLQSISRCFRFVSQRTYNYSVLPGEDGELIESGDKIPACGDVASDEDADGEDGERVHRALLLATAHDLLRQSATSIDHGVGGRRELAESGGGRWEVWRCARMMAS